MTSRNFDGRKSLYISPLAEEIVVSFEESFLGATNDPSFLSGRSIGSNGASGYNGDAFDSSSNHYDNL